MKLLQSATEMAAMRSQNKSISIRMFISLGLAWYMQVLFRIWVDLDVIVDVNQLYQYAIHPNWYLLCGVFMVLVGIQYACWNRETKVADLIYRHRLLLSATAVILLVILNVNGSSVHIISNYVRTDANGVLLGTARSIRSDEWATSTPLAFSQAAAGFPYFSSVPRGTATDMYITYGQAVKDYAVLFRPAYWGFLFLGASRGLSFFWWSRLFALFLVSFEFGMMLTNNQRRYSVLFSLMLTFSPFVQWWFAVVGMVEMLVFGMGSVLLFRKYLQTESYKKRIVFALLISWCGCVYILTLYPAWMVPIAYIFLCFVIWVAYENRNSSLSLKKDGLILLIAVLFIVCNLAYILLKSKNAIELIMNTAYPGKRRGGSAMPLSTLFYYVANFFTPLKDIVPGTNGSECSSFISFFPLGLVLFLYDSFRRRKVDLLSLLLTVLTVFFGLYTFTDLPAIVDVISMLQFSPPFRMVPIFMLVQLILLFREIANIDYAVNEGLAISVAVVIALASIWCANLSIPNYFSAKMLVVAVTVIYVCCMALMRMKGTLEMARLTAFILSGIVFFSGVLVNPIQMDTKEITNNQIVQIAKPVAQKDPEALWIVEGLGYPYINFLIPVGIPTINSTNVYPDLEKWHLLDEAREYEDIYNRYAHIIVDLTNTPTYFEEGASGDQFVVHLNSEDLKSLCVGYIYTKRDLTEYNNDTVELVLVEQADDDRIYKVIYN